MSKTSKLVLTSSLLLMTSSAMAVTPLYESPDSSNTQSLPSVRQGVHRLDNYQAPASRPQNSRGLQFPTTPAQIRAALKLDQSDRELRSKTRDLAALKQIQVGALVEFKTNSTQIIPTVELKSFGEALSDLEPGIRVEVGGHTDSKGSSQYNLDLSRRRAQAVKRHLVQNYGVNPQALTTRGYGEHSPIDSNATPAGRQLNRRVEFVRIFE